MRLTILSLLMAPIACATAASPTPAANSAATSAAQNPIAGSSAEPAEQAPQAFNPSGSPTVAAVPQKPTPAAPESGTYRARVTDAFGTPLTTFFQNGRSYVAGASGERYRIHLSNPTPRRVEAVIAVDGLDAIDGESADYAHKRGYILAPYAELDIDGFRTSMSEVATFRFAQIADSYAAKKGDAQNVGVIGVAFFPERYVPPAPAPRPPLYYPHSRQQDDEAPARLGRSSAPASAAPAAREQPSGASGAASAAGADRAESNNAKAMPQDQTQDERKGLGTEFGERRQSQVTVTAFVRASAGAPAQLIAVRYNDRLGLEALGIVFPRPQPAWGERRDENHYRENAQPFPQNVRFAQPPPR